MKNFFKNGTVQKVLCVIAIVILIFFSKRTLPSLSSDLSQGLEARWNIMESSEDKTPEEIVREGIKKELQGLKKYQSGQANQIKDQETRKMIDAYVDELNNGLTILAEYEKNPPESMSDWEEHQRRRSSLLNELGKKIPINVSEKNKNYLDQVLSYSENGLPKEKKTEESLAYDKISIEGFQVTVEFKPYESLNHEEYLTTFIADSQKFLARAEEFDFDKIILSKKVRLNDQHLSTGVTALFTKAAVERMLADNTISAMEFFEEAKRYYIDDEIGKIPSFNWPAGVIAAQTEET